ncbi:MAG: hypothetical protein EBZ77_10670 [Chitinophagia bacterium]|nr:hypothetical protein [Chitinophagia bacterium]
MDKERYRLIDMYFRKDLNEKFSYLKYLFFIHLAICLMAFQWPSRNWLLCVTALFAYLGFYVFTTQDPEWHLQTSLDRLMHQLMPLFFYVTLQQIAGWEPLQQLEQRLPNWVNGGSAPGSKKLAK